MNGDAPAVGRFVHGTALSVVGYAIGGLLLALLASEGGCGSTDGSFEIDDPFADPSPYCDATHFPGFPDSIGSALLVACVYLGPAFVRLAAPLLGRRTNNPAFETWGSRMATALLIAAAVITLLAANVEYTGDV